MATRTVSRTSRRAFPAAGPDRWDLTSARIRAYIRSVRPLRDCALSDPREEQRLNGLALIERLAATTEGYGVSNLRLTAAECADVLAFVNSMEPRKPETWWQDDLEGGPSHVVGYSLVLEAVERSLRQAPMEVRQ